MKNQTKFETRKVSELIPYARNARTHSAEQVAKLAGSIKEFGFINPVIISNDGGILAGHGRVLAARRLGIEEVPCVVESHLSETQKRAYILADNRLALDAGWDEEMLACEIRDLQESDFDMDVTGFDGNEIDKYLQILSFEPKEVIDTTGEIDTDVGDDETVTIQITFNCFNDYSSFLENEKQELMEKYGCTVKSHVME